MSEYTVLDDISNTILSLLRTGTGGLLQPDRITAMSPGDISDDSPPRLSLFLYQAEENPGLKNIPAPDAQMEMLRAPPLALNLYYLMTAYAPSRSTEQQIIGRAVQIFHDNAIIRGSSLQGGLSGTLEELIVTMQKLSLDDLNKLWSMFGGKAYRLSVSYRISSALVDSTRENRPDRIRELVMHVAPMPAGGQKRAIGARG